MKPAFVSRPVCARSPATSANLGPGYDALGLALQWQDNVVARVSEQGLRIDVVGEGEDLARDETHLVLRAMRATFDRLGGQPPGVELSCANRIPHGRGLGSSAAAIVSGVLLARALVLGGDGMLPDPAAFDLAAQFEGHPDNVAACFFGGITVAWTVDGCVHAIRAEVDAAIRPVVLVPPFESSTAIARGMLPTVVPHTDAAFGVARSALLMALLSGVGTGDPSALMAATEDRLHQPYRAAAMPQSTELIRALRADGLAAVVSGAGPTVLVLAQDEDEIERIGTYAPNGWSCEPMEVDNEGAGIVPVPHEL